MGGLLRIGLTGGLGSGKTTVADRLAAFGAARVDADQAARDLTGAGGAALAPLAAAFGPTIVGASGLDRPALRDLVFADPAARRKLESILHPLIRTAMQAAIDALDPATCYVVLDIPLLVESGNWSERVDRVLVVDCPERVQIERAGRRSGLSEAQARAILAGQATRRQRLDAADDVLFNGDGLPELLDRVDRLNTAYRRLAGASG